MIKKFCEFIKENWTTTTTNDVKGNEQDIIKLLNIIADWDDNRDSRKMKAAFGSYKGFMINGDMKKYSPIIARILGAVGIYANHSVFADLKINDKFIQRHKDDIIIVDEKIDLDSSIQVSFLKNAAKNCAFLIWNTDYSFKDIKDSEHGDMFTSLFYAV